MLRTEVLANRVRRDEEVRTPLPRQHVSGARSVGVVDHRGIGTVLMCALACRIVTLQRQAHHREFGSGVHGA